MSFRDPPAPPASASLPIASDFQRRFVVDAHTLVAEGYSRLDPGMLVAKSEEAISGLIVERVNAWFDDAARPAWTTSYFVKPEIVERSSKREGKKRPRIDIYVESSDGCPRPCFGFEAKRFYRSDSVAEYVGPGGLGAFLAGTYMPKARAAAMLGFVQRGSSGDSIEKVRDKLDGERTTHGLAEQGAVWAPVLLDGRLGTTWSSHHARALPLPSIDIYHSFLQCHDAAPEAPGGPSADEAQR